ncbi:MAG: hypothetical protein U5L08_14365 [Xanthomonadales bacterium]|nr:hypothetical protein [Xanthomonadales bacterium]
MAAVLLALMLPQGQAAGLEALEGEVQSVQLLDASQLGGGEQLVLVLEGQQGFRLPGQRSLPVGAGVRVSVAYHPVGEKGAMPEACSVRVVAVPIERDGEAVMQEAERPFEVYRNESEGSNC